jgi:hypothetical protein
VVINSAGITRIGSDNAFGSGTLALQATPVLEAVGGARTITNPV